MLIGRLVLCLVVGLLGFFAESQDIFMLALAVGVIVFLVQLFSVLKRPRTLGLANVLSLGLLWGYVVSSAIYVALKVFSGQDFDFASGGGWFYFAQSELSIALALIYSSVIFLSFISQLEAPLFSDSTIVSESGERKIMSAMLLMILGILFSAYAFDQLGYMGIQSIESSGEISRIGAIVSLAAPVIITLSLTRVVLFLRRRIPVFWLTVLVISAVILFPLGRRVVFYSIATAAICAIAIDRSWFDKLRRQKILSLVLLSILGLGIYLGSYFFLALRILTREELSQLNDVVDLFLLPFRFLIEDFDLIHSVVLENLSDRVFVLGYFAELVAVHSYQAPLWGDELIFALKQAIPSAIWPEKANVLPLSSEEMVHPALGLRVFDGPNSIVTAGLNDFGYVGAILYPVLLVGFYGLLHRFFQRRLPPVVLLAATSSLIYNLLAVEQSLAAFITSGIRNIGILVLVLFFLNKLLDALIGNRGIYRA